MLVLKTADDKANFLVAQHMLYRGVFLPFLNIIYCNWYYHPQKKEKECAMLQSII